MRHMAAYLVRSSRFEDKPAKAVFPLSLHDTECCCGELSVLTHTALDYRIPFTCYGCAYPSAADVCSLADAIVDLFTMLLQGVGTESALGDDDAPAGVTVEAVDASEYRAGTMCGKEI
jgi:hypothetical protein